MKKTGGTTPTCGAINISIAFPSFVTPLHAHVFFAVFSDCTVKFRHSQRTHIHHYKCTYANPTPIGIFKEWASKSSRLTKSAQPSRCRQKYSLSLELEPRTWDATEVLLTTRGYMSFHFFCWIIFVGVQHYHFYRRVQHYHHCIKTYNLH